MKQTKELAKNTAIIGIGNFGTKIISFLLLPLYTSLLSTEDYGTYDFFAIIASFIAPFASFLIDESMFRFLIDCKNEKDKRQVISQAFLIILLGLACFTLIYTPIALLGSFNYKLILYLYVVSSIALSFRNSFFRGIGKIKYFTIANLITSLLVILINILTVAIFKMGIIGLFLSHIVVGVGSVFFMIPILAKNISLKEINKAKTMEMIKYSIPLVPNSISWSIINTSDRVAISSFIGQSANGVYSIANKFPTIVDTVYGFFYTAWKESAAKTVKGDNSSAFYNMIYKHLKQFMFSVVLCILAAMPFIFNLLVKNDFAEAYIYMPILLVAIYYANISGYYGGIFTAYKNTKIMGITTIASAIINLVVDLALIKSIGIWAAAISTLASTLFMYLYRKIKIKKYVILKEKKQITILNYAVLALAIFNYYSQTGAMLIATSTSIIIYCIITNNEAIKKMLNIAKRRLHK